MRLLLAGLVLGSLVGGLSVPFMAHAQTGLQTTKPIYPWRTEAMQMADGTTFSHCQVKNMYDNGILLAMAQNAKSQRRLVIDFPQDKLVAKEGYDLQWQVDRQPTQAVKAIAAGTRTLSIALDDTMTRQIARGNLLFLRGPNDTLGFDMIGVQDAVRSLQDCLVSNNVKPAPIVFGQTPAPQASAPAPQPVATPAQQQPAAEPAPVAAPASVSKPTVVAAADVVPAALAAKMNAVGIGPKNVMRVPESSKAEQPFDVIWKQDSLLMGFKAEPPMPHQAMTQVAARFSRHLQKICNGEFLAEGGQPEKRGDLYVMPAEIACSPHDLNGKREPNSVAAMLLIMDARALHIVFIEAHEQQGVQAVQLRDKLMAQYR
jgi:hypothetical protein